MDNLKTKVDILPESPGVYIMKDADKNIIYIGKAKALKRRVSQYFVLSNKHSDKVKKMVSNIDDFDYIVTDSEFEALVLECSLIKRYKPKYNILLKDDKGYSYIRITNEKWPKIFYVKQKIDDGSLYFGPYVNSSCVKNLVKEVTDIFKLPTCNRNFLSKSRPCLNYYIKKCVAPCFMNISSEDYKALIDQAVLFIKNGSSNTIEYLNKEMLIASEKLNFEKAANIRDKIKSIKSIVNEKQKVVSNKVKSQDVIAVAVNNRKASVHVFRFENGNLYDTENYLFDSFEDEITLRTEFIKRYYDMKDHVPKNITLDGNIENAELLKKWMQKIKGQNVKISLPTKGDQFKLVQMCKSNAYEAFRYSNIESNDFGVLEDLKKLLSLKNTPLYIEAYDISNLQGSDNVGGMVVFRNMSPVKSGYRKFKIKTVDHQDDYGSIKEVMERRIKNYKENKLSGSGFGKLPDLILIDGGCAQTHVARKVFEKERIYVPIFGMVKDRRHRTRAITTHSEEIEIINNKKLFYFLTRIQDEVHKYTISYHKNLRNKKAKESILTLIPNVGPKRANLLLKKFKSIESISSASIEKLLLVKGITKSCAESIYDYFTDKNER